ncbi:MAG TPA: hypothetical protein VEB65_02815 [Solirubrobacterales bacterium]|nr:hypothetical protein [Solirubrobacterales bacterium]
MEILRNLLGSLSSGLIRLLVTVGIIAAVGYFVVRPVLDKTGEITKETNETIRRGFNHGLGRNGAGIEDVRKTINRVNAQVQREIKRSFHAVESEDVISPKKLVRCIQRAGTDARKIERCTVRF